MAIKARQGEREEDWTQGEAGSFAAKPWLPGLQVFLAAGYLHRFMAVFGPFSTVRAQLGADARFAPALAYLAEAFDPRSAVSFRINQLSVGASERVELAQGSFAIEQVYPSRSRPEGFFESHRKHIDVQAMVTGEELMEVEDITRLSVAEPYLEVRDFIKYADTAGASRLRMRAGDVAVFFPVDGHMPCLQLNGAVLVRKTVVKVPV